MKDAVIVSTARTPIAKAYRGGFNNLSGASLGAASVTEAVRRAGIEPGQIEDVIMGSALQQGTTGANIARQIALRAGLPVTTSGMTIDRQCSSGLMAVATAAKQVIHDGMSVVVGGGLDSISLVQNEHMNLHRMVDEELMAMHPNIHMPMLQTAEVVASRYSISRDAMDEYGLQSQLRTAAAYAAGKFDGELVQVTCKRTAWNKETGEAYEIEATVERDEGLRGTTAEGLAGLKTVIDGGAPLPRVMLLSCPMVPPRRWSWMQNWLNRRAWSRWVFTAVSQLLAWIPTKWASGLFTQSPNYLSITGSLSMTSDFGRSMRPLPCRCFIAAIN